jgi:hypothetical protein
MRRAIRMRACSPPESRETGVSSCSERKRKRFAHAALVEDRVAFGRQGPSQRDRAVQGLPALLEADGLQPRRPLDRAVVRLEAAVEQREQGRLAAAVGPDEPEPGAGGELEVEAGEDLPPRERLGEAAGDEELLRLAVQGVEVDARAGAGGRPGALLQLRELGDQPLGLLDAALRLGGACLRAALQPFHLAADPIGQRGLVLRLVAQHLVALLEEVAVAPRRLEEAFRIAAVELQHAVGDVFQEPAVVAHHQIRQGLAAQQRLQPEDALHIQVVRGLVHEQDVGRLDQLAGDREALLPAAGEDVHRLGGAFEAGLAEGDGDPGGLLEVLFGIVFQGLGEDLPGGPPWRERWVLWDVADADTPAESTDAAVRLLDAGQEAQQGRLPGTVRSHQPHAISLEETEGEVLEQRPRAVSLADGLTAQENRGRHGAGIIGSVWQHHLGVEHPSGGGDLASPGEELAGAGRDLASPGEELAGAGRDLASPGEELAGAGRDLASPGEELAGAGRELASPGEELAGAGRDLASPGEELAGAGRDLASPGEELAGAGRDLASPGEELAGAGRRTPPAPRRRPSSFREPSPRPLPL